MFNTQVSSISFFKKKLCIPHSFAVADFQEPLFAMNSLFFRLDSLFPLILFFLPVTKAETKMMTKQIRRVKKQTNKKTGARSGALFFPATHLFFFNLTFEILLVFRRVHMTNEMKKLITKNSCKIANKNTPSQQMTLTTRQMRGG